MPETDREHQILYSKNFFAIGTKDFYDDANFDYPPIMTKVRLFLESVPERHLNLVNDLWVCLNISVSDSLDESDEYEETEIHSRGEIPDVLSLLHAKVPNVEKLELSFYFDDRDTGNWDIMTNQEAGFLRRGIQYIMSFESLKSLELKKWVFMANLELFMEIWETSPTAREVVWSPSTDWENNTIFEIWSLMDLIERKAREYRGIPQKVSLRECIERTLQDKR